MPGRRRILLCLGIIGLIFIGLAPLYALPFKDDGDYSAEEKNVSVSAGDNAETKFDYLMEQAGAMVKHKADVKLAESEIKRKALVKVTAEGLLESGMSDDEVVNVLSRISSPDEAVMALRKCGKDICWIARAFEKAGYGAEEISAALPVDIDAGVKPAVIEPRYAGTMFAPVPLADNTSKKNIFYRQIEVLSVSEDDTLNQATHNPVASGEVPLAAPINKDSSLESPAQSAFGADTIEELFNAGYGKAEVAAAYIENALGWVNEKTADLINRLATALLMIRQRR